LAGQPQDPWQSPAQDQARPAWQPFTPSSADSSQDTYGYPESGQSAPAYGQSYAQRGGYAEPSYTVQDPAYGGQGQAYGDQSFGEQGRQASQPGLPGDQGQQAAHWQAVAGMTAAGGKAKAKGGDRGFFSALFDFSFTSFVTPKIIKVIYVLITVWTVLWALIFLRYGFKYGGAAGGFFTLLVVDPILIILTLGAYRMVLELFMVVHRMHEDLKAIRDRGGN
jgi:uncharacterized membrane protein